MIWLNLMFWNLAFAIPVGFSVFDFIGMFFADMQFILKIFVFMSIFSFAKNHIGGGPMAIAVILVMSWFVLFVLWPLFGTLYLLYMLGILGMTGIFIDFFFVMPGGPGSTGEMQSPISSGADVAKRMAMMQARGRRPMRPGG